jgi:hypothetical protein
MDRKADLRQSGRYLSKDNAASDFWWQETGIISEQQ